MIQKSQQQEIDELKAERATQMLSGLRRSYSTDFRQRVFALYKSGLTIKVLERELGISNGLISKWRLGALGKSKARQSEQVVPEPQVLAVREAEPTWAQALTLCLGGFCITVERVD